MAPRRARREKKIRCPKCGFEWKPSEIEPIKTWTLFAPMPDKEGRITVTVMGIWICPKCGHKVRGTYSKIKVGAEETISSENRTKKLIELLNSTDRISLKELSEMFGMREETIAKAINYLIKKGEVSGEIIDGYFVKR